MSKWRVFLHHIFVATVRRGFAGVAVLATAAAAGSVWAGQSTFIVVPLNVDIDFWGTVSDPATKTVILSSKEFTMNAGDARRVVDRLVLSHNASDNPELDNEIQCDYLDQTANWVPAVDPSSSGINLRGPTTNVVVLTNSLLLTAVNAGTYRCRVLAYTANGRTDYYATARSGETSMMISDTNEVGAQQWVYYRPGCQSGDSLNLCEYLGAVGDPTERTLFSPQGETPTQWVATNDATQVEIMGTIQVTSCYYGTASCAPVQWGPASAIPLYDVPALKSAQIESTLRFDQLYPDGTVCRTNSSMDQSVVGNLYGISNDVHHLPIHYLLTAPVSQNCMGSRTFRLGVYMHWYPGNPVKIDVGSISVINKVRSNTVALVPTVVGLAEGQATTSLQAGGLSYRVEDRVINSAPAGTVFSQNAPGGTVEPTGSQVSLQVSLGSAVVPQLLGSNETQARQRITAANLTVGAINRPNTCVDPGYVSDQWVAAGSVVVPGTAVNLTIPTCVNRGPRL